METKDIKTNLCAYDKRNPDCRETEDSSYLPKNKPENCYCDNCFYGRTQLANYALHLENLVTLYEND